MSEVLVKSILIGDTGVGKSTLINRLIYNQYLPETISTMGVEFHVIKRVIDNVAVKIHLWDTAGQESLRTIIRSFYFSKTIYYLLYDISNRQSFENIEKWIEDVKMYSINDDPIFVIIGNKNDQYHDRVVTQDEGIRLGQEHNAFFMEISCKDGIGIEEIMTRPIHDLFETRKVMYAKIPKKKEIKKSNCCQCNIL